MHISYPHRADAARAQRNGESAGGAIMIHGLQNGLGWLGRLHRFMDWTDGCIAVTNAEMDEIWKTVPDGTPIEIGP
ncbi:MAG TPA: L,D-transpeptidase family protein [Candidatus Dormibacteraeota bacterium]|nr:L,D-transpeptidase family protein [Candidatus Dormibacteraeota bacterium]